MSDDLYPTPTRLALLRQVANGQVCTDFMASIDTEGGDDVIVLFPDAPTAWSDRRRVTARIREMEAAGWVRELTGGDWFLTDAGQALLDAHGRT